MRIDPALAELCEVERCIVQDEPDPLLPGPVDGTGVDPLIDD